MEKRIISIILMLTLTFALAACGTNGSNTKDVSASTDESSQIIPYEQWFVKKGIAVTENMIEKASINDLFLLTTEDAETESEMLSYIERYKYLDGFKPDRAIVFRFTDQALDEILDTLLEQSRSISLSSLSSYTRKAGRASIFSALLTSWNANSGYGFWVMTAMSLLGESEAFQKPAYSEAMENPLVVLLYDVSVYDDEDNMLAICLISFQESNENIVFANAGFLFGYNEDLEDLFSVFYSDAEHILPQLGNVENDFKLLQIPQTGVEIKVFDDSELKAIQE